MKELIVQGKALPIHFGMKAINDFVKRENAEFEQAIAAPEALGNLDSIVSLAVSGLNEGARLAGKDDRYTEDDIWDMLDAEPNLILEISDAFIESVEPLTEKLGSITKNSKRPAAKGNRKR